MTISFEAVLVWIGAVVFVTMVMSIVWDAVRCSVVFKARARRLKDISTFNRKCIGERRFNDMVDYDRALGNYHDQTRAITKWTYSQFYPEAL